MYGSWEAVALTCLVWLTCLCFATGQDEGGISGCGGFVRAPKSKSAPKLKYDSIEVHLVTADGAVKDKTECAPHNGYFFVPTFEQVQFSYFHFSSQPSEIILYSPI